MYLGWYSKFWSVTLTVRYFDRTNCMIYIFQMNIVLNHSMKKNVSHCGVVFKLPKIPLHLHSFRSCTTYVDTAMSWTWRKWTESIEYSDHFNIAVPPPPPIGPERDSGEQIIPFFPQSLWMLEEAVCHVFIGLSQKSAFLHFFPQKRHL